MLEGIAGMCGDARRETDKRWSLKILEDNDEYILKFFNYECVFLITLRRLWKLISVENSKNFHVSDDFMLLNRYFLARYV